MSTIFKALGAAPQVLSLVLQIIKAVKELIDALNTVQEKRAKDQLKLKIKEALGESISEMDQRKLEEALAHPNPGRPTDTPGSVWTATEKNSGD